MDLVEHIASKAFLGSEFLTWLWFEIERTEGILEVPGFGEIELYFGDLLIMAADAGEGQKNTIKGGDPTMSIEARAALALGKKVLKAKISITKEERTWAFSLQADKLEMGSVTVPSVLSKDTDEKLFERMALLEELDQIFTGIYTLFLNSRVAPSWKKHTLPDIQHWTESQPFVQ